MDEQRGRRTAGRPGSGRLASGRDGPAEWEEKAGETRYDRTEDLWLFV